MFVCLVVFRGPDHRCYREQKVRPFILDPNAWPGRCLCSLNTSSIVSDFCVKLLIRCVVCRRHDAMSVPTVHLGSFPAEMTTQSTLSRNALVFFDCARLDNFSSPFTSLQFLSLQSYGLVQTLILLFVWCEGNALQSTRAQFSHFVTKRSPLYLLPKLPVSMGRRELSQLSSLLSVTMCND